MDELTTEYVRMEERRVRAMLQRASAPQSGSKRAAVMKLLGWQPLARGIRWEGKCPDCKRDGFMSYTLPQYPRNLRQIRGEWQEDCGWWCPRCQFGNAGSREAKVSEVSHE